MNLPQHVQEFSALKTFRVARYRARSLISSIVFVFFQHEEQKVIFGKEALQ